MRRALWVLALVACGGGTSATPATPSPSTTAATTAAPTTSTPTASATASVAPSASASATASTAAITPPPPSACTGADLDLDAALALPACQTAREKMPDDAMSHVHIDVERNGFVAPGAKAVLIAVLENKSDATLPLTFKWPLEHARVVAIKNAAGKDMRDPGAVPCSDPSAARATALAQQANELSMQMLGFSGSPPRPQIVMAPKGHARARIEWSANGRKWSAPKGTGKNCTADVVDAPLAPGEYHVTIALPDLEGHKLERTIPITVR